MAKTAYAIFQRNCPHKNPFIPNNLTFLIPLEGDGILKLNIFFENLHLDIL
jgi:hypothetical protein